MELIVNIVRASEVLTGNDQNSGRYIANLASAEPQKVNVDVAKTAPDNTTKLYNAVIRGNRDGILDVFKTCLSEGIDASVLVNDVPNPRYY